MHPDFPIDDLWPMNWLEHHHARYLSRLRGTIARLWTA